MSCEGSQGVFFAQASEQPALAAAFGGPQAAQHMLEQVFATARAQAETKQHASSQASSGQDRVAKLRAKAEDEQAKQGCLALFQRMKERGIRPPAHSKTGLPKREAQYGYAAIERTLQAVEQRTALPALAQEIHSALAKERQIHAMISVHQNLGRCANCGRFASLVNNHICPQTTDAPSFQRALMRRFGVPSSAYPLSALKSLIDHARQGDVPMQHNITGETVHVTLDGLLLAIRGGFVPQSWHKVASLAQVELPSGAVVPVLQARGLNQVQLAQSATQQAAVMSGFSPHASRFVQATMGSVGQLPQLLDTACIVTDQPVVTIQDQSTQAYDKHHFFGTEFRKRDDGSYGQAIEVAGETYRIGDRYKTPEHRSSARGPLYPQAPYGIAVGRTLVHAAGLLKEGSLSVNLAPDQSVLAVEVYNAQGGLLSSYHPQSQSAGDTLGSRNASAEQMAAVIAYRAMYPQAPEDYALAQDLHSYLTNTGKSPVAVADSAYISLLDSLPKQSLLLGGQLTASRCADCGQFQGSVHTCPVKHQVNMPSSVQGSTPQRARSIDTSSVPSETPVVVTPTSETPVVMTPTIQVTLDTEGLASALREQQPIVQLDSAALADALKTGLAGLVQPAAPQPDERLAASMERLAAALQQQPRTTTPSVPAPSIAPPEPMPEPQPRMGMQRPSGLPITPVEHIVASVRLPAPDPYLRSVPSHVGGQRRQPLPEQIPALDPDFEVNEQTERILRVMSTTLQAGAGKKHNTWSRAFSIYGPPGTGKNSLARQLAASLKVVDEQGQETQGIHYAEVNITADTSLEEAIGSTILTKDPDTGATISKAQLGKIGLAAAMGSVICINEIVRNPKLATELQSMLEDGEIHVNSPEAGLIKIPVHPATVFVMTWNPGLEGDADRPAKAALERTIPLHLGAPSEVEQIRRIDAFFSQFQETPVQQAANAQRVRDIMAKEYAIRPNSFQLHEAEKRAAVRFFQEVNTLATGMGKQIGLNSAAPTGPGPRQLQRFLVLGKTVGWAEAKETLRICCDQDESFQEQWNLIEERFTASFGHDGRALERK
jgi:MoxR-like ATPase